MADEDPARDGSTGPPVTVLVPAGGSSRRWEGRDKTAALLAGVPVLVRVVEGAVVGLARSSTPADRVVVVAPEDHPARAEITARLGGTDLGVALVWTREHPPGGGPVAALHAGIAAGGSTGTGTGVVVVAGDLPFARTALPRLMHALAGDGDAAVGVDPSGYRQPLLAAYRAGPLVAALAQVPARGGALRDVLAALRVAEVPVTEREALDLDTPALLRRAEELLDEGWSA